MTPVASASSVSTVTASPNPATAGAHATYTVTFTTSATGSLAISDPITLIGPTGTVFPLVASDYSVNGTPVTANPVQSGSTGIVIEAPLAVANSTLVTVVAGVNISAINPTTAGPGAITVTTSADATASVSNTYTIVAGPESAATTTIVASPTTLVANGSTQSTITVQAKDANGNNLTTSGGVVTLHSTIGTIGAVTDNADGTYTADIHFAHHDRHVDDHRHHRWQPDNRIGHHWAHPRTGAAQQRRPSWPARRHWLQTARRSRPSRSRRRTPTATTSSHRAELSPFTRRSAPSAPSPTTTMAPTRPHSPRRPRPARRRSPAPSVATR